MISGVGYRSDCLGTRMDYVGPELIPTEVPCSWHGTYDHYEGMPFMSDYMEQWEIEFAQYHKQLDLTDHVPGPTYTIDISQQEESDG